jgi:hypothetical protein
MTDWYDRKNCTPEEKTAREIIDKIGSRGYIAPSANLTFMSRLIESALLGIARQGSLRSTRSDRGAQSRQGH